MRNIKGFTLVEILITIALIGILSAMAALTIPGMMDSYKVRGAARQLYSDMQMARLRAIKEGKEFAVEFSGNTYCVKNQINTATSSQDGWTSGCATTEDTIIKTVTLASDYSGVNADYTSSGGLNSNREIFYTNGTASSGISNATWAKVTLSSNSRTQSVCVRSHTGNIRIVDASSCS